MQTTLKYWAIACCPITLHNWKQDSLLRYSIGRFCEKNKQCRTFQGGLSREVQDCCNVSVWSVIPLFPCKTSNGNEWRTVLQPPFSTPLLPILLQCDELNRCNKIRFHEGSRSFTEIRFLNCKDCYLITVSQQNYFLHINLYTIWSTVTAFSY